MTNAADRKEIRKARGAGKVSEGRRREEIVGILRLPSGRRYLYSILSRSGMLDGNQFAGENSHATAFNLGVSQFGHKLAEEIRSADRVLYTLMLNEADVELAAAEPTPSERGRVTIDPPTKDGDPKPAETEPVEE